MDYLSSTASDDTGNGILIGSTWGENFTVIGLSFDPFTAIGKFFLVTVNKKVDK